jgi:hypothetical protein
MLDTDKNLTFYFILAVSDEMSIQNPYFLWC